MEKVINILMIEDDTLDVMDAQRTLDRVGLLYIMQVVKNGEEALEYLERTEQDNSAPRPDVMLLDLNMPKMNGIEFLQIVKNDARFRDLKVFVITTSEEKEDKEKTKALGVSGFIVKPLKFNNPSSMDSFNLMIDLMNIKNRM